MNPRIANPQITRAACTWFTALESFPRLKMAFVMEYLAFFFFFFFSSRSRRVTACITIPNSIRLKKRNPMQATNHISMAVSVCARKKMKLSKGQSYTQFWFLFLIFRLIIFKIIITIILLLATISEYFSDNRKIIQSKELGRIVSGFFLNLVF